MSLKLSPSESEIDINPETIDSFALCLSLRAEATPDQIAMRFYPDGDGPEQVETYASLDAKARAVAARLMDCAPGDRALLMYNEAPAFLAAFFGCLYAGVVAVPVFLPRDKRTMERFLRILDDSESRILLTSTLLIEFVRDSEGLLRQHGVEDVITTNNLPMGGDAAQLHLNSREDCAFIQYTSGSTQAPRGVIITHGAVTANTEMFRHIYAPKPSDIIATWCPMEHDLGLIGCLLAGVYAGVPSLMTSPLNFLRNPMWWLTKLDQHKVTHTMMPNFAFDLCVAKTTREQRRNVDLSVVRFFADTAEPVRWSSIDRFLNAFVPCGLAPRAIQVGLGLAEATAIVSGTDIEQGARHLKLDRIAFQQSRVVFAGTADEIKEIVSCGAAVAPCDILIVDNAATCSESTIGEIWVTGPHVAAGYWNKPEETKATFHNKLPGDDRLWLRTGDLGFMHEGELYVTGRIKDLIILRGRNLYPPDIEEALAGAHGALRPGCTAVFGMEVEDEERIAVAAELRKDTAAELYPEIVQCIRRTVAEACNATVEMVALLPQGGSFKTSSGKLQRSAMSAALMAGTLESLHVEKAPREEAPAQNIDSALASPDALAQLETWMAQWLAERMKLEASTMGVDAEFVTFGVDSLAVVDFTVAIEKHLGCRLPDSAPWSYPTIRQLAVYCLGQVSPIAAQQPVQAVVPPVKAAGAGFGPLEGTLADFRVLPGHDVIDRTRPFQTWRRSRLREGFWGYMRLLHAHPTTSVRTRYDDGKDVEGINLGSIDYLGLSTHPLIKEAAIKAIHDYGPHSASVPGFAGGSLLSHQLESAVGEHMRLAEVVLFPTGWTAGWGSVAGLVRSDDHVVLDLLAHNCLQQGARAATHNIRHFSHLNTAQAEEILKEIRARDTRNAILVVSEGLYSMDSDWPQLEELQQVCHAYDARLLVDISHDIGSMGPQGTGQIGAQGRLGKIDLVVSGFSKGLATNGGFLACHSSSAKEYLKVYADSNLFATALSPMSAGVAIEAIRIARSEEGERLRDNLELVSNAMRNRFAERGVTCGGWASPLIPVIAGSEARARMACKFATEAGVITNLIEYPAVPVGQARLRLQLMATHTLEEGLRAADIIADAIHRANEAG